MTSRGLVAALLLLLCACGGEETSSAGADGASLAPVPAGLRAGCPPPETPLRYPGGDLPVGAVAVRLCPGEPTIAYTGDPTGPPIEAPADELTSGADAMVELVNGLPDFDPDTPCHMDDGPHHVYGFRYPDGDARAVAYDEAGCHTAVVGDHVQRQNGEELATAFADALLAQRAATNPPRADDKPLACPMPPRSEPTSVLPAVPLTLTAATWCVGVGPYRMRSTTVPDDLLERLNSDLLDTPAEGRDRCEMAPYSATLEGVTVWGDRVSFLVPGCRVVARTGFGRDNMSTEYEADPQLLAAIQALPLGPAQRWQSED